MVEAVVAPDLFEAPKFVEGAPELGVTFFQKSGVGFFPVHENSIILSSAANQDVTDQDADGQGDGAATEGSVDDFIWEAGHTDLQETIHNLIAAGKPEEALRKLEGRIDHASEAEISTIVKIAKDAILELESYGHPGYSDLLADKFSPWLGGSVANDDFTFDPDDQPVYVAEAGVVAADAQEAAMIRKQLEEFAPKNSFS